MVLGITLDSPFEKHSPTGRHVPQHDVMLAMFFDWSMKFYWPITIMGRNILEHVNIILSHVTCRIMVYEDIVWRQDIMWYKDGFIFILIIFIIKIALIHLTTVI